MAAIAPKKQMIVKLITKTTHTLSIGDVTIDDVEQTGGWEGFLKLQTPDGDELIVEETDTIGNMQLCKVIKGTSELIDVLSGKVEKKPGDAAAAT